MEEKQERKPSSIRKKLTVVIKFEPLVNSTKIEIINYSKLSARDLDGLSGDEVKETVAGERIQNTKGKGFYVSDLKDALIEFLDIYLEENELPESRTTSKVLLDS